jgi:hypothetical protein
VDADDIRREAIERIATAIHARHVASGEPVRISGADLTIGEVVDALGDLLPVRDDIATRMDIVHGERRPTYSRRYVTDWRLIEGTETA